MSKVFDDALLERAAREAARALAQGEPDILAGRFSPKRPEPRPEAPAAERPPRRAAGR